MEEGIWVRREEVGLEGPVPSLFQDEISSRRPVQQILPMHCQVQVQVHIEVQVSPTRSSGQFSSSNTNIAYSVKSSNMNIIFK